MALDHFAFMFQACPSCGAPASKMSYAQTHGSYGVLFSYMTECGRFYQGAVINGDGTSVDGGLHKDETTACLRRQLDRAKGAVVAVDKLGTIHDIIHGEGDFSS